MALSREPVSDAETGLRGRAGERPRRGSGRKTLSLIDGKKKRDRPRGERQAHEPAANRWAPPLPREARDLDE